MNTINKNQVSPMDTENLICTPINLDSWKACATPVICIFDGQYDISKSADVHRHHYTWGIDILPMDETTAFDVLKDKVAGLIEYHDDLEEKASNLLNHGNIDGDDNADQRTLDHVLTEQLQDDQEEDDYRDPWETGYSAGWRDAKAFKTVEAGASQECDVKKSCSNCASNGMGITEEPCDSCWNGHKFVAKKETLAADSLETCFTCEFAALDVHKEPCFTCFKQSAWTKDV